MSDHLQNVTSYTPKQSEKIRSYRKESSFWREMCLIDLDKGSAIVSARFYGSSSVVYCCVWIWPHAYGQDGARGAGKAGGYGYDKRSAALSEALSDAGVTLAKNIAGVGESAEREAMEAIARQFGIVRPMIHEAHA
jgi:hypothetical protein